MPNSTLSAPLSAGMHIGMRRALVTFIAWRGKLNRIAYNSLLTTGLSVGCQQLWLSAAEYIKHEANTKYVDIYNYDGFSNS